MYENVEEMVPKTERSDHITNNLSKICVKYH